MELLIQQNQINGSPISKQMQTRSENIYKALRQKDSIKQFQISVHNWAPEIKISPDTQTMEIQHKRTNHFALVAQDFDIN